MAQTTEADIHRSETAKHPRLKWVETADLPHEARLASRRSGRIIQQNEQLPTRPNNDWPHCLDQTKSVAVPGLGAILGAYSVNRVQALFFSGPTHVGMFLDDPCSAQPVPINRVHQARTPRFSRRGPAVGWRLTISFLLTLEREHALLPLHMIAYDLESELSAIYWQDGLNAGVGARSDGRPVVHERAADGRQFHLMSYLPFELNR